MLFCAGFFTLPSGQCQMAPAGEGGGVAYYCRLCSRLSLDSEESDQHVSATAGTYAAVAGLSNYTVCPTNYVSKEGVDWWRYVIMIR